MEVSDQIIKVLDNLGEKFGIIVNKGVTDVLPYLQQLSGKIVAHEIATSYVWIAIGVLILILGTILMMCEVKRKIDWDGWGFALGICTMVGACILISVQVFDIVNCYTFPEQVVTDYIKDFLNNNGGKK